MPPVHPKGIDNYKIFNNAPKFHYQHCINMYKFILLYLGAIFQFTHDLGHKFIIDLLVLCHFLFIDSINLPRKCDNQVLVKQLLCTGMQVCTFFLFMYNSSSMCYFGNIVEILNIYIYTFIIIIIIFAMKWMKMIYTCINSIQFNSIALSKIKLQKTRTKNCHQNQTSYTMNL